jgi:hypothetical protein
MEAKRFSAASVAVSEEIHGDITPGQFYDDTTVSAEITFQSKPDTVIRLHPWRISPFGMEFVIDKNAYPFVAHFSGGDRLNAKLYIGKQESNFFGLTVVATKIDGDRLAFGVRWFDDTPAPKEAKVATEERRKSRRWLCGDEFLPIGICQSPIRFNDFIHFKILDLSTSGLMLVTSLRNRYLVPGLTLDTQITFPMFAQVRAQIEIKNTRVIDRNGKSHLGIGAELKNPSKMVLNAIGQYIFQFGPPNSIAELKKHGLNVPKASQGVEYSYARSIEEYQNVLELRRTAYLRAQKIAADVKPENLSDALDAKSRIIVAKYRQEVVASTRLVFHGPEDSYEVEKHTALPANFPSKYDSVEASRLCIHPDFQKGDIFLGLFKQLGITAAQARKRYIVSFASDEMLPFYMKAGATKTSTNFKHSGLNGLRHHVIVWDIAQAISGSGVNPFVWDFIYSDLKEYLESTGIVEFTPMMNLRANLYKSLRPIAKVIQFFKQDRRRDPSRTKG